MKHVTQAVRGSNCQSLTARIGSDNAVAPVTVTGRVAWALDELIKAGSDGCTPITTPAPRWSDYVRRLRTAGFSVRTINEKHGGAYPGRHGRYVLESEVAVLGREEAAT
jgi:hypothetical protein